jgi:putative endonuclease
VESTRKKGAKGENLAVRFLITNGYNVIEQNYRSGRSEIDIIARRGDLMVFVEVKTRKNNKYGYPESFLSEAQKERIHYAAEDYIAQNEWKGSFRFDIIAIISSADVQEIDHFEDAF